MSKAASRFMASGKSFYPAGTVSYTPRQRHDELRWRRHIQLERKVHWRVEHHFGAADSFTFTGEKPANSSESWTMTGKVGY
jgi:hypothetical protein